MKFLPFNSVLKNVKVLIEQEALEVGKQQRPTKQGVREPLTVEVARDRRESVKTEAFEERVFDQMTALK